MCTCECICVCWLGFISLGGSDEISSTQAQTWWSVLENNNSKIGKWLQKWKYKWNSFQSQMRLFVIWNRKEIDLRVVFQSLLTDISAATEILLAGSFWMSNIPDLHNTKSPLDNWWISQVNERKKHSELEKQSPVCVFCSFIIWLETLLTIFKVTPDWCVGISSFIYRGSIKLHVFDYVHVKAMMIYRYDYCRLQMHNITIHIMVHCKYLHSSDQIKPE